MYQHTRVYTSCYFESAMEMMIQVSTNSGPMLEHLYYTYSSLVSEFVNTITKSLDLGVETRVMSLRVQDYVVPLQQVGFLAIC